jgi:hypothetical protein
MALCKISSPPFSGCRFTESASISLGTAISTPTCHFSVMAGLGAPAQVA